MRMFCSLIFLSLFLYSENINEQIHALQNATPQERVELMNSIKEQLISMNEEKRIETLETLRNKLQHNCEAKHEPNEVKNEMGNHNKMPNHRSVEERTSHENMFEHEEVSHMQNHELNQHREYHEEHSENNAPRGEPKAPRSEPRDNNHNGRTK